MENLEPRSGSTRSNKMAAHVVQAVEGFFRSISLRNEDALQDTLRLLTLWFKYGAHDEVSHAMASGFSTVEVDTWLEVIPQARSSFLLYSTPLISPLDHRSHSNASH